MDAVGGQINAFTTKECTCFYARVLDTHLAQAADILCDMFFSSRFDEADVATERGVILEEIGMYEDNPRICAPSGWRRRSFRAPLWPAPSWAARPPWRK